jgi:hypothetical protein
MRCLDIPIRVAYPILPIIPAGLVLLERSIDSELFGGYHDIAV